MDHARLSRTAAARAHTPLVVAAWVATIVGVHVWGEWLIRRLGRDSLRLSAPPVVGWEDVEIGWPVVIPVLVGALALWVAVRVLPRLSWRQLLAAAALLTVAWSVALALARSPVGGADPDILTTDGLTRPLVLPGDEYLLDVPAVGDDPSEFLRDFTTEIDDYVVHVRSHPPGFLILLWALDRTGLGGTGPAAALCVLGGAAGVVAVLVAARELCGSDVARAAAPFVALAPAVLWVATTADALFAGVVAWSVALAALASGREGRRATAFAVGAGILWGAGLLLSYAMALVALPLGVVLIGRRRWTLLPWVAGGALVPLVVAWLAGFSWIEGLFVTRREYAESVARTRPHEFFFFSNVAALAIVVGVATVVGLVRLRDRRLRLLLAGFGAAMLLANASSMSKGEVERIWLPFALWLPLACAALTPSAALATTPTRASIRTTSGWLAAQLALALVVQITIRTRW